MPPIVGFVGFKGGSGKTLLAFQMAERAQSAGFRVLLWDLRPRTVGHAPHGLESRD